MRLLRKIAIPAAFVGVAIATVGCGSKEDQPPETAIIDVTVAETTTIQGDENESEVDETTKQGEETTKEEDTTSKEDDAPSTKPSEDSSLESGVDDFLTPLVEAFNSNKLVEVYEKAGGSIKATKDENGFKITINSQGEVIEIAYKLDGSVLSIELDEGDGVFCFTASYITMELLGIIGDLQGSSTLSQLADFEQASNYTLEKDGFEIEVVSDKKRVIKVDLAKTITSPDLSGVFMDASDFEGMEEFICGDGFVQKSKGSVTICKSGNGNEHSITVGEDGELTSNAYKSLVSMLEVMFEGDDIARYFEQNAPDLSKDVSFDGFTLDVDPEDKDSIEEQIFSGYRCVRVTIDKELAMQATSK